MIAGFGILVAFLGRGRSAAGARALRRDLGRFNRWSRDDMRWLRTFGGDRTVRLGKFNPGQKLNATFIGAAAVVLAATGSIMKWNTALLHRHPHRRRLRARLVRAVRGPQRLRSHRDGAARPRGARRAWSAAP